MSHTSTHSTTGTLAQPTTSFRTIVRDTIGNTVQPATSFRTIARDTTGNTVQPTTSFRTTPTKATAGRMNTFRTTPNMTQEQVNPPQVFQDTSHNRHLESCMHVHQPMSQVCKPGESLALRKVKHPLNGKTSVSRLPLTKQDILSQYSGCFEEIGNFPGDPYKFHLKPDYKPARHAPRKVPAHLETAFKEEIESLVKQGILEEVKEHTDWVNSYVIVEKDTGNHHSPNHTVKKKLRICLDPRDLNEALEREPYHTRSVDEITAKLQGMTVFTIVDFKKSYWMVVLHPDSRKLTCMALPFGRFQWTHLPMGTVVAQNIFQSKLDAIFIGMEGVTGIADDMIIAGKDEMEHDRNSLAFMEKCMENNLILNSEKIQFKQSQVSFYGHIWSENGISPDPKKIQALKHMEFSPDMENIPIFLGKQFLQGKEKFVNTGKFTLGTIILINFLNRYSALSTLTHQAIDYKPGRVHQNFQQLKMENSNMKAFPHFSVNAETTLQTDASKKGPRANLIQKGKDIPVTDTLSQVTPMNPENDIQLPIRKANMITTRNSTHISTHILMSVQPQDSLSNKLDQLRKSTVQGNQLTRLSPYINTGFPCDKKSLHKCWNDRETLSIKFRMNFILSIICMIIIKYLMSEHSSDSISNRLA